jgi:hypothetical protein
MVSNHNGPAAAGCGSGGLTAAAALDIPRRIVSSKQHTLRRKRVSLLQMLASFLYYMNCDGWSTLSIVVVVMAVVVIVVVAGSLSLFVVMLLCQVKAAGIKRL